MSLQLQETLEDSWGTFEEGTYKVNYDLIDEFNGTVIGNFIVPDYEISKVHNHQTRACDIDYSRIERLKIQIGPLYSNLKNVPVGEFAQDGKIKILSGHHRIEAIRQNSHDQGVEPEFPMVILKFVCNNDREFFKQRENAHDEAKSHGKLDAIKFLSDMYSRNYQSWQTSQSESNLKSEAYKALSKAGYIFDAPRIKNEVFKTVFSDRFKKKDTVVPVNNKTAKKNSHKLFGVDEDGFWNEEDEFILSSSMDASMKSLMHAVSDRATAIEDGKVSIDDNGGEIKIYTHILRAYRSLESLNESRGVYLDRMRRFNKFIGDSTNTVVVKVAFAPQFRSADGSQTEVNDIIWSWDSDKQIFIQQEKK